ncbi:hypothetical protein SBOR_9256 [Sclerotinia borealis F-4128]|uniref:Uncharacterized protein n=1 Tax=Sclerotinia borealis (strain F-4128) TaxID=1432307 RepID=W9C739_SCLBF|nr:hypothetical protein SBOR_9256 [Sclerotinia borealis F-4128]
MVPSNPRVSDDSEPNLPGYNRYTAARGPDFRTLPLSVPGRYTTHTLPITGAASYKSNTVWTPANYPWTSSRDSDAIYASIPRTLNPPEPPLPPSNQEYSAASNTNQIAPPLPVAAARAENFSRARGIHGPSRLSREVFANDYKYRGQSSNENATRSSNYNSASLAGLGEPIQHEYSNNHRKRSIKYAYITPDNPISLDSSSSTSTSPSRDERSTGQSTDISYQSAGSTNKDRSPAQRATERLWAMMYQDNPTARGKDLTLIAREGSELETQAEEDRKN